VGQTPKKYSSINLRDRYDTDNEGIGTPSPLKARALAEKDPFSQHIDEEGGNGAEYGRLNDVSKDVGEVDKTQHNQSSKTTISQQKKRSS
jgi:hypothetical protein